MTKWLIFTDASGRELRRIEAQLVVALEIPMWLRHVARVCGLPYGDVDWKLEV